MGFAGHRSFDRDNDGKLDTSKWEMTTPRRPPVRGNEEITEERQALYGQARNEYISGRGEIRGLEGIYKSARDFLKSFF